MSIEKYTPKLKIAFWAGALVLTAFNTPAMAAWSGFVALSSLDWSDAVTSKASCSKDRFSNGNVFCAYRGANNALFTVHNLGGTSWTDPQNLDGTMLSAPSCTDDGGTKALCAFRGLDNSLYVKWYESGAWGDFQYLAGIHDGDPSCIKIGTGKVSCTIKGVDAALYTKIYNGTSWSTGFKRFALPNIVLPAISSSPSCAYLGGIKFASVCAATGLDNKLHGFYFEGGVLKSYQDLGINSFSDPHCTSDGLGNALCSTKSTNGAIYVKSFANSKWNLTYNLKGAIAESPNCAYTTSGKATCVMKSVDGLAYSKSFNGVAWDANYSPLSPNQTFIVQSPNCITNGTTATCALVDTSSTLLTTTGN